MKPERWRQIERVWNEAIDRPAEERGTFLDGACRGDPELRQEVVALLAAYEACGRFLEEPAILQVAALLARRRQS